MGERVCVYSAEEAIPGPPPEIHTAHHSGGGVGGAGWGVGWGVHSVVVSPAWKTFPVNAAVVPSPTAACS